MSLSETKTSQTLESTTVSIPNTNTEKSTKQVIQCPNFDEQLKPELMDAEMDIDLKTSKSLTGKQYILAIPITQFFRNVRNMYALINILNGQSIISLRLIEYFVVNYVLENNTFFDINRYNKHPEFLTNNLRGKCQPIPELSQPVVIDKHTAIQDLSQNISAQQQAYKNARAEIVADIKAKAAAATGRAATSANSKKNNISIDTFFNMKQITNHTAQYNLKGSEKNFDNYIIVHDNYKCQLKEYNKKNFDPFCRWNRIRLYYDKNKFFYTTIAQLNFFKWAIEKHILDYVIENLETIEKSMNEYEKNVKAEKMQRKAKMDSTTNTTTDLLCEQSADANTIANDQQPEKTTDVVNPVSTSANDLLPISLLSTRKTKKRKIILANPETKSKVKERKKKEFTKTNRSILFFSAYKVVSFD